MRTSSSLVDTGHTFFVCGRFSHTSDIYRSTIYAHHREYLNIVNARKLVTLRPFPLHVYENLNPVFKNVRREILGLCTFIKYIC